MVETKKSKKQKGRKMSQFRQYLVFDEKSQNFECKLCGAVCIHGTELIKEAFNEPAFLGKHFSEAKLFYLGNVDGIVSSNGATWSEQRQFAMRHLRDFGFGKSSMEEIIMTEVNELIHWLKQQQGQPISLQKRFSLATLNSLWKIIIGNRFMHDDPMLNNLLEDFQRIPKLIRAHNSFKATLISYYPSIAKMFPNWSGWSELAALRAPRVALYDQIIKEHKLNLQEDSPRDFIDVYLQEIRKTTDLESTFHPNVGEESLKSVLADLFLAGSDTLSVSLNWVAIYLFHHPRVQLKLHQELDRVVGRSRSVNLSDRQRCVYTEAVIWETLRVSSIIPVHDHASRETIKFKGYDIPKGTLVFANFYASHHDPEVWGDHAEEFRPERFLSPNEAILVNREKVLAFSTGRRNCMGEKHAMDTLFLFAANLGQNFEIKNAFGDESPLPASQQQFVVAPVDSLVSLIER